MPERGRISMPKEYAFTTRHSPAKNLYQLDLEEHMHQMAKMGWEKGQRHDKTQPG
jgi:hypothetical protein